MKETDNDRDVEPVLLQIVERLITGKSVEESLNAADILSELSKQAKVFAIVSTNAWLDRISLGLEHENEFTVRATLSLLNTILSEYSKDGSNKRINISNFSDEEEKSLSFNSSGGVEQEEDDEKFLLRQSLATLLPLVSQILKPESDRTGQVETAFGREVAVFGSMRLEAVEFMRIVVLKFGRKLAP